MVLAQLLYYIGAILSIPLLPFFILQGRKARKNIPRLPEALLNKTGIAGNGQGNPFRLLTIGESTIAGVGVTDHKDGFSGQLAVCMAAHLANPVAWTVVARSGYDARAAQRNLVQEVPEAQFDLIVIGLGGNDTFYLNSPLVFRRQMVLLIRSLRVKLPNVPIVIASLPPVGAFPALPGLVRRGLGILVNLHGIALRRLPFRFSKVFFPGGPLKASTWLNTSQDIKAFFSDGIHPSALTYRLWAEDTLRFMVRKGVV
jgi:lysophospholipase L1-like esterase